MRVPSCFDVDPFCDSLALASSLIVNFDNEDSLWWSLYNFDDSLESQVPVSIGVNRRGAFLQAEE